MFNKTGKTTTIGVTEQPPKKEATSNDENKKDKDSNDKVNK